MPSQFVIVGRKGVSFTAPYILTSDDSGLTWAEQASNSLTFNGSGIVYSGAQYVATGFDYTIETSPDGKAWTKIVPPSTVTPHQLFGVAYNGSNLYVASGVWQSVKQGVLTSPDGAVWTQSAFFAHTNILGSPAYGNGLWLIPADLNNVITSPDGFTWTYHALPTGIRFSTQVATYAFGLWILSVLDTTTQLTGRLFTSPDGITWTERALPTNQYAPDQTWYRNINAFALSGTTLYACTEYIVPDGFNQGAQPLLFQSTDGIHWSFGPDVWVPNGADPVALSADLHGNIVMTGNDNVDNNRLYIARSGDSGASWANVYPSYTTGAELLANPGLIVGLNDWQIFSAGLGNTTWTDGLMNTTYANDPSDYSYFYGPVTTVAGTWYQVEVIGTTTANASTQFYFDNNSADINLLQGGTKGFFQASYTGLDNIYIDMINTPGRRGVAGHATRQVTHVSVKEITLDPLSLNADMHGVAAGPFTEPPSTQQPVRLVRDPWDVDEWGRFYPGAGYHQIT